MKASVFFALALIWGASSAQATFLLNILPIDQFPRAKCLDGSQGGYYISKGDPNVVVIHFEGSLNFYFVLFVQ